ncbi:cytochrome C oxidase subunit IV family protein [Buchnera aphidicola]|uniref:cytochrome C oxidase subunit IV family protein n=1 Tax=Buchnera aphidicola TaxID=9 RepID=UPI0031B822ED
MKNFKKKVNLYLNNKQLSDNLINFYFFGFLFSFFLTLFDFLIVYINIFSKNFTLFILLMLLIIQILIQMKYFIHLKIISKNSWNIISFFFMLIISSILFFGTIWIMFHLNHYICLLNIKYFYNE